MKRIVLASVLFLPLGIAVVSAQDDPVATRQNLMKGEGNALNNVLGKMAKGQTPYNQAIVDSSFDTIVAGATKEPSLFPETSKNAPKSQALPKIWDNLADFDGLYSKLARDATAAKASVKDVASLKTAVAGINKDCSGCHEVYRASRS